MTLHPRRVIRPLADLFRQEAAGGVLLIAAAVVAMVWANSPWDGSYTELWGTHATIGVDGWLTIELTLREWINDAAMVLFFFVVGLEIKRELVDGELRDPRQAALPIIAALGGMIVPAVIFVAVNPSGPAAKGWGIPMATDIAIVAGIVTLLGNRVPSWLRLFLLALAIVDDIGAIVVIAVFYSDGVSLWWLALAAATLVVAAAIRRHVSATGVYVVLGVACWVALHEAHIHPTLAGVAFGLLAPVTPRRQVDAVDAADAADAADIAAGTATVDVAASVATQARESVSVVEWLSHRLHPYSAFVVVPVFALANAGVKIPLDDLGAVVSNRVTWGVFVGLVIGKLVGVAAFTLAAVRVGVGRLPDGVTTRYVIGGAALAGVGFTVSLFVTELAFGHADAGTDARLGVVVGSLVAGLLGAAICYPGRENFPDADDG